MSNCCGWFPPPPPPDMDDKNRFQPENRFVGDIEDGKRYPFDVYKKSETYSKEEVYNKEESDAKYATETEAVDIRARLDALEYKSIVINNFTVAPSVAEMGSSQTITLAWTLNKQATSQNINGSPVTGNSKQYTGVSSSQTYTLNVSDGQTSASKTAYVTFANRVYFGAAADLTTVTELSSVLSNDSERTITVNAGAGEYIIYAIPARLGDVVFYVSGFEGGFEEPLEQTLTNDSEYSETYKVYRSTNASLGETTVEVREG
ncbi:MAG: hypothetical protein J6Y71_05640 [Ruminococcus sp.]|nr:hypothetical protein [Ruminococcus sp.]